MFSIDIDITPVIEEFNLILSQGQNLGHQILKRIVDQYIENWERLVGENLNQTKDEYLKAIGVNYINATSAIISLDARKSSLALKLEDGADPWDIKEDLKLGTKVKTTKDGGWYVDVPFRFATSSAVASSPIFSAVMPQAIQRIVKKQSPAALGKSQIPKKFADPGYRKEITNPVSYPRYDHKVSVYEGLRRIQTGKRGGKYMNFRRVSDNSDEYSWIHPGLFARKFMDKALDQLPVDDIVDNVIDEFLSNLE